MGSRFPPNFSRQARQVSGRSSRPSPNGGVSQSPEPRMAGTPTARGSGDTNKPKAAEVTRNPYGAGLPAARAAFRGIFAAESHFGGTGSGVRESLVDGRLRGPPPCRWNQKVCLQCKSSFPKQSAAP